MKILNRIDRVKMALAVVRDAERRACAAIHAAYPKGESVSWLRGGHIQDGIILNNCQFRSGDRFRVRNTITGKEYWIDFYDVQCAAELLARGQSAGDKEGGK